MIIEPNRLLSRDLKVQANLDSRNSNCPFFNRELFDLHIQESGIDIAP